MESLLSSLKDEAYFMGGGGVGACDFINNGCHLGHRLGFHQELEVRLKPRNGDFCCA